MKKVIILLVLYSFNGWSQVGIGTVTRNATLEIKSSNEATPSSTDGLLIPKIDEFPSINPTVLQDGMMVFATGTGTVAKGFYSWDNGSTSWVFFGGSRQIDDLVDGKSDNDGTEDGSSVFLGVDSGLNDDNDDNKNVGLGYRSLATSTNGYENTAIGWNALTNSNSLNSTAVGSRALQTNTSGTNNSAFGKSAMRDNTVGDRNVAMGAYTLGFNISGNQNTSVGYISMASSTSGEDNTALGFITGGDLVSGINNTFIRAYSGGDVTAPAISGSISFGYSAGNAETNDNRLYIENSNSTTPLIYGEFDTDILGFNGDIIVRGTATDREIKLEDDAGNPDRVLMRQTATQDIYVGDIDDNGGDTYVRAGGSAEISVISGTGFVGVNTTTPAYTLEVNGNAAKPGGGSWINPSDRRLKRNVQKYISGLESILKIDPVTYQYNQLSGFDESATYVGVIAQDLQKVAPSMVTSYSREGNEYLAVDNSAMTYLLINAVKDQQTQIELLKKELSALKVTLNSNE